MTSSKCLSCDINLIGQQISFCSNKCSHRYHYNSKDPVEKKQRFSQCLMCEKQFVSNRRKFCSKKCYSEHYKTKYYHRVAYKNQNCLMCKKELTGKQRNLCSPTCRDKYHWTLVKSKKPDKKCTFCKNIVPRKYCSSVDCRKKLQKQKTSKQSSKAKDIKLKLIAIHGGLCQHCGYCENYAALQFHHIDPKDKSFALNAVGTINHSWEKILEEASKCMLLCANCHFAEHHPQCSISNAQSKNTYL